MPLSWPGWTGGPIGWVIALIVVILGLILLLLFQEKITGLVLLMFVIALGVARLV